MWSRSELDIVPGRQSLTILSQYEIITLKAWLTNESRPKKPQRIVSTKMTAKAKKIKIIFTIENCIWKVLAQVIWRMEKKREC
jgi:hypothetical protein